MKKRMQIRGDSNTPKAVESMKFDDVKFKLFRPVVVPAASKFEFE